MIARARWPLGWRRALAALVLLAVSPLVAHVGSPDTWFEGRAGAYPVRVSVRTPGVVPGLADITVRVIGGGATSVTVQPYRWDVGPGGAPPPDPAAPVPGDAELWSAQLWFMAFGSHSVDVRVEGPLGGGAVVVPVMAVATRTKAMDPALGAVLGVLGLLLAAGVVSIAAAAAREASLPPGAEADAPRKRRGWLAMAGAAGVLALLLTAGRGWWNAVEADYRRNLFRTYAPAVQASGSGAESRLALALNDSTWGRGRRFSPLMPDHGKLMHLFLVRDDLGAFAHLHPVARDSAHFDSPLPALPAGTYRLYADIVHESGFAQTLEQRVTLDASPRAGALGADEAMVADVAPAAAGSSFTFADGTTVAWRDAPSAAGQEGTLAFALEDKAGRPLVPEPYLGMAGHLILTRDDGAVFVHLHPSGTASMAAQLRLALRQRGDTSRAAYDSAVAAMAADDAHEAHRGHGAALADGALLRFPYAFPQPGRYRLWVQFRVGGTVRTAVFATEVQAPSS
ncbi:MAG: hypothetical protein NW201_01200 [Gemmatimonadales bacterium]|nr:hypothetical protein [Gemmatimonadales bacterium]